MTTFDLLCKAVQQEQGGAQAALHDWFEERGDPQAKLIAKLKPLARNPNFPKKSDGPFDTARLASLVGHPPYLLPREREESCEQWLLRLGAVPLTEPFFCKWAICIAEALRTQQLLIWSRKATQRAGYAENGINPSTGGKAYSCAFLVPAREWQYVREQHNLWAVANAVNNFTRTRMREEGFFRRVMMSSQITNDELDREVETDAPRKVLDEVP